ncbi:hypothetical protein [Haloarcula terrestris]|nr:hypothetical protein [Haloarcula terrestris]
MVLVSNCVDCLKPIDPNRHRPANTDSDDHGEEPETRPWDVTD